MIQGPLSFRLAIVVIPAQAGTQCGGSSVKSWIPACAGMTSVPGR